MPLLFSYGSLQQADVQLATFGRHLSGERDELLCAAPSLVRIEDPEMAAATGRTHHANVTLHPRADTRVPGTVFEVDDQEFASVDRYEAAFSYRRILARLASGREAWVYVHTGEDDVA